MSGSSLGTLLDERYSCRAYDPRNVPRETIEKILRVAQRTASWCNTQPWHLHIASGAAMEKLRAALLEAAMSGMPEPDFPFPGEYRGVYQARRRECGWSLYEAVGIAKGDRAASGLQNLENFRMFGAPHVAILTTEAVLGVYGAVDCGAYVSNFMLAAKDEGIATIAQAALAGYPKLLKEQLGIPADRFVVCGISFGYADETRGVNRFRTTRADPADVVTWVE